MDNLKYTFNYNFNYNLLLIKQLICNIPKKHDFHCVLNWIYFLMKCDKNLSEMKLRNEFLDYLVFNLHEGFLRPPFHTLPPKSTTIGDMANLIPGRHNNFRIEDSEEDDGSENLDTDRPTMMSKSPDGGLFLSLQPVPHEGSFCYLAITTKKKTN